MNLKNKAHVIFPTRKSLLNACMELVGFNTSSQAIPQPGLSCRGGRFALENHVVHPLRAYLIPYAITIKRVKCVQEKIDFYCAVYP